MATLMKDRSLTPRAGSYSFEQWMWRRRRRRRRRKAQPRRERERERRSRLELGGEELRDEKLKSELRNLAGS